ncbi:MAG TPA: efflux RND transporter periplasmic adaptor subunit [Microvirga sp.]|jgi:RND family efflux transporter MFP subunit|nr:efflux RND transporter periplasmic adaptor subunit [Microvirga sp.]
MTRCARTVIAGIGALLPLTPIATSAPAAAQSAPPPVTVATPVVKEVTEYDDYTGRFEAVDFVEVRARVSGYLDRVAFTEGTLVNKGDLLFVIDRRPYQAALDQAEAAVQAAQARVAFAQGDFERAQSLSRTGNISEQVLEQRRQTLEGGRADLMAAQAAARTARLNLGFAEIRAPIAGRIGRKLVSEGNLVGADMTLLTTLVSVDTIYFSFDVDERSFLAYQRVLGIGTVAEPGTLKPPILVGLTDEREPSRQGRLDFIDNRVDQATGTMRARASVENRDLFITPGLFGTIRVPGSPPYQGVLVPDEAIATDQDRRFVWVVGEDQTVSARVVRPGPRIDGYRLIRHGLTGGETIVVAGLQRVRAGSKVAAQRKELPPVQEAQMSRSAQVQVP